MEMLNLIGTAAVLGSAGEGKTFVDELMQRILLCLLVSEAPMETVWWCGVKGSRGMREMVWDIQ